jgi:hypothetical protein
MSLPIVLIVIATIISIFSFAIILLVKKNNVSLKQSVDKKPVRVYKNGEQEMK